MLLHRITLLMLLILIPQWVLATTWYVRPPDDGEGNNLSYGPEDGTSWANAFHGFNDITGLSAGDTVCLPAGDEPFFQKLNIGPTVVGIAGTAGHVVQWRGCGVTKALLWSAQGLNGDRSFNSSRVGVNGATYVWDTVAADIYRKKVDVRLLMLWEDATWLQPVNINASSEATILATLAAGSWGNKNNGDGTFRVYYRATTPAKSPANTRIRADYVPGSGGAQARWLNVGYDYQTFYDLEVRGHTSGSGSARQGVCVRNASHVRFERVDIFRNNQGPCLESTTATLIQDIIFKEVNQTYSAATGFYGQGGTGGIQDITIDGGNWSHTEGTVYNGTGFTVGDGDGIGFGQSGGSMVTITIQNVTASYNKNAGVFFGTSNAATFTNFSVLGSTFVGNNRNCVGEGSTNQVGGVFAVIGNLCVNTDLNGDATANYGMSFNLPNDVDEQRTILLANNTFVGNGNRARVLFNPTSTSFLHAYNNLFVSNPGNVDVTKDKGDFYSQARAISANDVWKNNWFYSFPNVARPFAVLGTAQINYLYGGDLTAFEAATGGTGNHLNENPLVNAVGQPLSGSSPLLAAGFSYAECVGLLSVVCTSPPAIGAYQSAVPVPVCDTCLTRPRTPRVPY